LDLVLDHSCVIFVFSLFYIALGCLEMYAYQLAGGAGS